MKKSILMGVSFISSISTFAEDNGISKIPDIYSKYILVELNRKYTVGSRVNRKSFRTLNTYIACGTIPNSRQAPLGDPKAECRTGDISVAHLFDSKNGCKASTMVLSFSKI